MEIKFDTSEFDQLVDFFEHRANNIVQESVTEGRLRAADYASRGAVRGVSSGHLRRNRRRLQKVRVASGALIAKFIERVMYKKLVDFFGDS